VWCSWYSLFTGISEEIFLDILPGLHDLPFDVFQVDDGWQISLGDWQPNDKFPPAWPPWLQHPLRRFYPGLWLAPLAVAPKSNLFQQHSECCCATSMARRCRRA